MEILNWVWLGIMVVLLVVEMATTGLTTIWFAGGALVAFLMSLPGAPLWSQILAFLVISVVLLAFTRPIVVKALKTGSQKTNVDGLIGQKAKVIAEINNFNNTGDALVGGQEWTARAEEDAQIIPEDTMVEIVGISGVKLIVKKIEE